MSTETQNCPICSKPVEPSPRYPRYVCDTCGIKACSADGRALNFYNESFSGGYLAEYADTGEPYLSHDCYIDGIKCFADEAHMGGIVIQIVV